MTSKDGEHFDGVLEEDERSPDGFKKVDGVGAVLIDPVEGRLVITGRPSGEHNCDLRGCGTLEHKIAEWHIEFEP